MAVLKFKIEADPATFSVDSEDYRDEYTEYCEGEGAEPESEVPAEFVRSRVEREFEEGDRDLGEVLEQASVQVTLA